jgi:hypothetical protein
MMQESKSLLFLKKKKQKDFFYPGHGCLSGHSNGSKYQKFFGSRPAAALFQKRTASL